MLPQINLDDESFLEVFEKAKKKIPVLYPEWTDFNEHDPGITFLELFSYMKTVQQYHMDFIGEKNYKKYLKLIGMQQRQKQAAKALVSISEIKENLNIKKETKLLADEVCFETIEDYHISKANIIGMYSLDIENKLKYTMYEQGKSIKLYVFGKNSKLYSKYFVCFDNKLEKHQKHKIYFEVFKDYKIKRNSIDKEFFELAKIKVECYTIDGWKKIELLEDKTHNFILDGKIEFIMPYDMEENKKFNNEYMIRFVLMHNEYDISPIITKIDNHIIEVVQEETLIRNNTSKNIDEKADFIFGEKVDCFEIVNKDEKKYNNYLNIYYDKSIGFNIIYEATGFPNQKIELENEYILEDSIQILVENEIYKGKFEVWEKVKDLDRATKNDRFYQFDEQTGTIIFGDGETGIIPEARIIIIACKTTRDFEGNVNKNKINKYLGKDNISVRNLERAIGGRKKESVDECFKRFKKELYSLERCVTNEDYENVVKQTEGLIIKNVKALLVSNMKKADGSIDPNVVNIVVEPFSLNKRSKLTKAYINNITNNLYEKRLIGTKINIISPEYIGIDIYIEVSANIEYHNSKNTIKKVITDYLENMLGFGENVSYSDIYGIIDSMKNIIRIKNLNIDARGYGISKNINGDVIIPSNGVAYLENIKCIYN